MGEQSDQSLESKAIHVWRTGSLVEYILSDLDTRVKKDRAVKLGVFFTGLSSHLKEPINLFLKGESGSGKTYNTTETLRYFPQENIWYLGGMSQKALVHSHGVLLNKNGEELDLENRPVKPCKRDFEGEGEYEEALRKYKEDLKDYREELRESYNLIDMSHKILVFLEAPEFNTFQMLRPILSHDKEEIEYRFVDKTSKGQLQTMRVVLKGWPATIFLTTSTKYMEELATRSFTATPESTELKILEANVLTNLKACYPWQYSAETEEFKVIQKLIQKLEDCLSENQIDVVIPFKNLYELFPKDISRDMRDFQHFSQFLKTLTLLHYFQRPYMKLDKTQYLIATLEDVERALEVYREIFETTRSGTEKRILDFYHNIVKTRPITTVKDDKEEPVLDKDGKPTLDYNPSWYLSQLTANYNKTAKKKLSEQSIRVMLDSLDQIGYVDTQNDPLDKRCKLYVPLNKAEEKVQNPLEYGSKADLKAKLEKGFESWKENPLVKTPFYLLKNLSDDSGRWGETEIDLAELTKCILESQNVFSSSEKLGITRTFLNEESKPKLETEPETNQEVDSKQILNNSKRDSKSNLGIPCPYCKAQGREMFFNSDADLQAHVSTFHETREYVS